MGFGQLVFDMHCGLSTVGSCSRHVSSSSSLMQKRDVERELSKVGSRMPQIVAKHKFMECDKTRGA